MFKKDNDNFQTPDYICDYMISLLGKFSNELAHLEGKRIYLEPTPGIGNLVRAINKTHIALYPVDDFWESNITSRTRMFDGIIMNPPFSPATEGYKFLDFAMDNTDRIIALMPWWTLINSQKRTKRIMNYGLLSVIHLPRNVFPGARIQTCILNMKREFIGKTEFKVYNV